jgi:decaprenylphospho-beta-D-erythro-pentofuranosid-2-ulose 2-reductase
MKDALGSPQSALVLGGTSEIAIATIKQLVAQRLRRVVLAGRNLDTLKEAAAEIESVGTVAVDVVAFDALAYETHNAFVDECFATHKDFDLALVAFGTLGDQETDEADNIAATNVIESNFTGAASVLLPLAAKMRKQGHGSITVLSSVAGERARSANFIYGSAKAGLDAFCQGLGDSLVGSGVKLMVVRPGFVTTKMTAHLDAKPMSTNADAVATDIVKGLGRGSEIIWSPAKLQAVFAVMRHLPRPVFRRIKA